MHEPHGVRVLEPGAHLGREADRLVGGEATAPCELAGERDAFHVFHDDVRPSVRLAAVVDAHDVRVREPRREAGLAQKPSPELDVRGEVLSQHLDRHVSVELAVARPVDDGHPAGPQLLEDRVPAAGKRLDAQSSPFFLFFLSLPFSSSPSSSSDGGGAGAEARGN